MTMEKMETPVTPEQNPSPQPEPPMSHLVVLHRVTNQGVKPVYFIPRKVNRIRSLDGIPNEQTSITDDAGDIKVSEPIPEVIAAFQDKGIEFIRLLRKDVPVFFAVHNIVRVRVPAFTTQAEQCEVVDNRGGITVQTPIDEVLDALNKHLGKV